MNHPLEESLPSNDQIEQRLQSKLEQVRKRLDFVQVVTSSSGNALEPELASDQALQSWLKHELESGKSLEQIIEEAAGTVRELVTQEQSFLQKKEITIEQAIQIARQEKRWVTIADLPLVQSEHVRIYRGVKPIAITTEFADAITEQERDTLSEKIDQLMQGKQGTTTSEFMNELRGLMGKVSASGDRFFADNPAVAQEYAVDGVVYYLDVPVAQLWKYRKENLKATEIVFAIPNLLAKNGAKVYAVGPGIPENTNILPK